MKLNNIKNCFRDSVYYFVRKSVRDSVYDSGRISIRDSVLNSVWNSVSKGYIKTYETK